jgi:hypothetical protein
MAKPDSPAHADGDDSSCDGSVWEALGLRLLLASGGQGFFFVDVDRSQGSGVGLWGRCRVLDFRWPWSQLASENWL